MRALLALLPSLLAGAALAQAPGTLQRAPDPEPRRNQRIERIHLEDAGNRIEELRVGGESQSVTVQPQADVPAWQLQPTDLARSRPADRREGFSGGTARVWNLLNF